MGHDGPSLSVQLMNKVPSLHGHPRCGVLHLLFIFLGAEWCTALRVAEMSRRRVPQRVDGRPVHSQGAESDGDAEAAAVLAAMPTGQSLLRWITPASTETDVSTRTAQSSAPAAPSGARPPLARGRAPFGGVTPPPRRPGRPVALARTTASSIGGTSGTANRAVNRSAAGTPPRVGLPSGRAPPLASPSGSASRKSTAVVFIPSPVSVSGAAEAFVPESSTSQQRWPIAPPAPVAPAAPPTPVAPPPAAPPAPVAPPPAAPPAPVAPPPPVALPAPVAPPATNDGFLPVPVSLPPGSSQPSYGATGFSHGSQRPSPLSTAVRERLSAIATKPRVLGFRSPRLLASDLEAAMGSSLTPAPGNATLTTPKVIQKRATKPRARRAPKNAEKPANNAAVAPHCSVPDPVPGAAGASDSTPADESQPPAPGVSNGSSGVTVLTLTRVFAEGLRPVCAHLVGLSQKLDEVQTTVNRMSTSMQTQGVGNERTAQAVVQLQGAVQGAIKEAATIVKPEPVARTSLAGGTSIPDDKDERLALAVNNEAELRNVRDVAKRVMVKDIVMSTSSFQAMPSRARALEILYAATERVRKVDRAGAAAFLDSRRIFLLSDGSAADKRTRVSEKLHRVRSHVIASLQKVAMLAYFKSLGVNALTMSKEEAEKWLESSSYASSPKASDAVNASLSAMFLRSGAGERVVAPDAVGEETYVDASTGHVALVTHWARGVFEKIAGVRKPRRSGNDDCAYDCWRKELRHVSGFLRRHEDIQNGLRLCDGSDKRRAMVVADDGTFVVDDSDEEEEDGSCAADRVEDDMAVEAGVAAASKNAQAGGDAQLSDELPVADLTNAVLPSGAAAGTDELPVADPTNAVLPSGAAAVTDELPVAAQASGQLGLEAEDEIEVLGVAHGELPESSVYPLGFAEYLEEEPLE